MKFKFYPFVFIAVLIVINIFLLYRIINFDAKFQTLQKTIIEIETNRKPTNNEILVNQFKEESYIRQQERDTTLILAVFAIFAGLTAFITFKSFTAKIKEHTAFLDKKYEDYDNEYKKHYEHLIELEARVNLETSYLRKNDASEKLSMGDFEHYTFYILLSCEKMAMCLKYYRDNNAKKELIKTLTKSIIDDLKELEGNITEVNMYNTERKHIKKSINNINKIENEEIYDLLSKIYYKLIFPNP